MCPDEDELSAFADGLLSTERVSSLEEHLDGCARCHGTVAAIARLRTRSSTAERSSIPEPVASLAQSIRPGDALGRFIVLKLLGMGAMGVVFSAYDPVLDRRSALKVLRTGNSEEARARLSREAKALARLNHPNVISVYEVGSREGQIFVAMELVEGTTLAGWLRENRRSWREIVGVFVQAGRGLAAAHAAGLVHRDFKPENVLMGADGRVRVTDFGLAREAGEAESRDEESRPPVPPEPTGLPSLTRSGAVVGTPAYMAPEQLRGGGADARSDQFSFCVALHEALHGEPPFAGATLEERLASIERGSIRAAARSRAPASIRRALYRGLSADPSARFGRMDELLSALERGAASGPRIRRWSLGLAVATAIGSAVGVSLGPQPPLCRGAERRLIGVWDEARRDALRGAFRESGSKAAARALEAVEKILDEKARTWVSVHTEACEANQRGESSEQLLDRTMACLGRRLKELDAFAATLGKADAVAVSKAVDAARSLEDPALCADAQALAARQPLPADPAVRQKISAAEDRLASLKALEATGKGRQVLGMAEALREEVRGLYGPLEAESALVLAVAQHHTGNAAAAERSLFEAAAKAHASGDDRVAALAWVKLISVIGIDRANFELASMVTPLARAAIDRSGAGHELEPELFSRLSMMAGGAGRYADALAHAERAIALLEGSGPPDSSKLAMAYNSAGLALFGLGRYAEAVDRHQRAATHAEAINGREHPWSNILRLNVAFARYAMGDLQTALSEFEEARRVAHDTVGAKHPTTARTFLGKGMTLSRMGRYSEALDPLEQALRMRADIYGPEHPNAIEAEDFLAEAIIGVGRVSEALVRLRKVLEVRSRKMGADHPAQSMTLNLIGRAELSSGRPRRAIEAFERARTIVERAVGPEHPDLADSLVGLGQARIALKDARAAVALLGRAVQARSGLKDPFRLAEAQLWLARALWESGDRSAALNAAREAWQAARSSGPEVLERLVRQEAWVATHALGPGA